MCCIIFLLPVLFLPLLPLVFILFGTLLLVAVALVILLLGVGSFVAFMAIGGIVVIAMFALGLVVALLPFIPVVLPILFLVLLPFLPVVFVGNVLATRLRKDEKLGKNETTFPERVATLSCSSYRASLLSHALASVKGNQTYQYLLIKENVDLLSNSGVASNFTVNMS